MMFPTADAGVSQINKKENKMIFIKQKIEKMAKNQDREALISILNKKKYKKHWNKAIIELINLMSEDEIENYLLGLSEVDLEEILSCMVGIEDNKLIKPLSSVYKKSNMFSKEKIISILNTINNKNSIFAIIGFIVLEEISERNKIIDEIHKNKNSKISLLLKEISKDNIHPNTKEGILILMKEKYLIPSTNKHYIDTVNCVLDNTKEGEVDTFLKSLNSKDLDLICQKSDHKYIVKLKDQYKEIDALVKDLESSNESKQNDAADKLSTFGTFAIPILIRALQAGNKDLSMRASIILSKIGNSSVEPLTEVFKSSHDYVKENALRALAEIGNPDSVPLFLDSISDDFYARMGLENVGKPAIPYLVDILNSNEIFSDKLKHACDIVKRIDEKAYNFDNLVEKLYRILGSSSDSTKRQNICDILGHIGGPRALEVLNWVVDTDYDGIVCSWAKMNIELMKSRTMDSQ